MVRRVMIKLIKVMTYLVILGLIEVQANNLSPTTFHSSSLSISLPLPSKLNDVRGPFYLCLESFIKGCSKDQKSRRVRYLTCVGGAYPKCFHNLKDYKDDPVYKKAIKGHENCVKNQKSKIHVGEIV